jgi:hypothetical protein
MIKLRLSAFWVLSAACLALLGGCKKDMPKENLKVPRLLIETKGINYGSLTGSLVKLPISGTRISVQGEPLVNEFEIYNVELVEVDMGKALLVEVSEKGARDLYRGSVANMGARIVLTVNGTAIGARRIDGAIQDGKLYTFVEVADDALDDLVLDLKESIVDLQTQYKY